MKSAPIFSPEVVSGTGFSDDGCEDLTINRIRNFHSAECWPIFPDPPMPPTFKTITLGIALFLSFSSLGYPQYGQLPFANQVSVVHGSPAVGYAAFDQYGQPASYDNYSYPSSAYPSSAYPSSSYPSSADPVNELYNNNAKKPLRGLFAQGFTRTLTVLGGANFLNSIEGDGNLLGSIPGGGSLPSTTLESETGYAISFAFGRRHNHRLRSEIELALRENDSSFEFEPSAVGDILGTSLSSDDEDEIRAYSIMKNFIWGFETVSYTHLTLPTICSV